MHWPERKPFRLNYSPRHTPPLTTSDDFRGEFACGQIPFCGLGIWRTDSLGDKDNFHLFSRYTFPVVISIRPHSQEGVHHGRSSSNPNSDFIILWPELREKVLGIHWKCDFLAPGVQANRPEETFISIRYFGELKSLWNLTGPLRE